MTYRAQWKTLRTSRRRKRSLTCVYSANSTWKDGGWFKSNAVEGETIATAIIKRKEKIKVKPLTFSCLYIRRMDGEQSLAQRPYYWLSKERTGRRQAWASIASRVCVYTS